MTQTSATPQFVSYGPLVVYGFTYRVYERSAQAMRDAGLGDYRVEKDADQIDRVTSRPFEGDVRVSISGPNGYFATFFEVAQPAVHEFIRSGMSGASDEARLAATGMVIDERIAAIRPGIERR